MASEAVTIETFGKISVTLGGTVSRHDLVNFSAGSSWVQSDATGKVAEAVALQAGVSGDIIEVALIAVITDADAPFTLGNYFVGVTPGAFQAAVSTTGSDLEQGVGYAITTSTLLLYPGMGLDAVANTITAAS